MLDLFFVLRWNLVLGIPDMLIACVDVAAVYTFRRFFTIPSFVLASKIAPVGQSGTYTYIHFFVWEKKGGEGGGTCLT